MGMRDAVLDRWEDDTRKNVDGARDIQTSVLIDTLPAFYDNIAEALTSDYPLSAATSRTDVASAHGDERARMTDYGPEQVIHEYQLFKEAFARRRGARASPEQR
jgi:hypothetical protein